jgi:hypothetical protein
VPATIALRKAEIAGGKDVEPPEAAMLEQDRNATPERIDITILMAQEGFLF